MSRFLLCCLVLFVGCSSESTNKKVAQNNEKKNTVTKKSLLEKKEAKFKPSRKGVLGIDPTKGINAKPADENDMSVGEKPIAKDANANGTKPNSQNSNASGLPESEFDYLFDTLPKKDPTEFNGKYAKKVSSGDKEQSSGDWDDPLSVVELKQRIKTDAVNLSSKPIHVTGEVVHAGIGKVGDQFLPVITLSNDMHDRPQATGSEKATEKQRCILSKLDDLLLSDPGGLITVQGVYDPESMTLAKCKITDSYGNMVNRMSAEDFAGLYRKDAPFVLSHFQERQILLRGTVKSVGSGQNSLSLNGVDGVSVGLRASPANQSQFEGLKSNQQVYVIGRVNVDAGAKQLYIQDASRIDIVSKATLRKIPATKRRQPTEFGEKDRAVLAFTVNFEKLLQSEFVKTIGWSNIVRFAELDMYFDVEYFKDLKRISGYVGKPKNGFGNDMHQTTDLFVRLETKSETYAKSMEKEFSFSGFQVVVKNGERYWLNSQPGAPSWMMWREGHAILVSTERYLLVEDKSQLASVELKELLKKQNDSPFFVAANIEGARNFANQFGEFAKFNLPPSLRTPVEMLKSVSTLVVSSNQDGDLLSVSLTGTNSEAEEKVTSTLNQMVKTIVQGVKPMLDAIQPENSELYSLGAALSDGIKVAKRDGAVVLAMTKPAEFDRLLVDAAKATQRKIRALKDVNLMQQATLSLWNFNDVNRKFPFAVSDRAKLSWRVWVLPYFEHNNLYDRFDIEKDWDDKANAKWSEEKFNPFRLDSGATISFVESKFIPKNIQQVEDGGDKTIALVEDRRKELDPWTKPSNISPEQVYEMVSKLADGDSLVVGFYDGRVRRISNKISKETVMKLCDPKDGKSIEDSEIK